MFVFEKSLKSMTLVPTLKNWKKKSKLSLMRAEKELVNTRARVNKIENRKIIERFNETERHYL